VTDRQRIAWLDDPWFSGFCDGEACFFISLQAGTGHMSPRLKIALRADDGPLLEDLRRAFGGAIYLQAPAPACSAGSRPQYHWHVLRKADLAALVAYFERFPLRSKKARDCRTWSEAVRIYCANGGNDQRLLGLRTALMEGRSYEHNPAPERVVASAQLELIA
jgi:hypothetical protein